MSLLAGLKRKRTSSSVLTKPLPKKSKKTKKEDENENENENEDEDEDEDNTIARKTMQEALRQHFENQFGALDDNNVKRGSGTDEDEIGNDDGEVEENDDGLDSSFYSEDEDSTDFNEEGFTDFSQSDDEFTSTAVNPNFPIGSSLLGNNSSYPQVVSYTRTNTSSSSLSSSLFVPKSEKRKFLSSKPLSILPSSSSSQQQQTHQNRRRKRKNGEGDNDDDDDDEKEELNLKNDLALQRLLQESHLLEGGIGNGGSISLAPRGLNRLKAIESRIQSLGGAPAKQKMPLPMRLGILAYRKKMEEKRIKEAKENGIVLEKKVMGEREKKKMKDEIRRKRKDRVKGRGGLGGPSVGKFRNGALLRLSSRDVKEIEGVKKAMVGKRRKKGGKGKKKRG